MSISRRSSVGLMTPPAFGHLPNFVGEEGFEPNI
jgi:hypothetical protein